MNPGLWAVIGEGLKIVEGLVKGAAGSGEHDGQVAAALEGAGAAVRAMQEGLAGQTDPQLVLVQLKAIKRSLVDLIADNDADALKDLHDKFDHGGTE